MKKIIVMVVALFLILVISYVGLNLFSITSDNGSTSSKTTVNEQNQCVVNGSEHEVTNEECEQMKKHNGVSQMDLDYETSDGEKICYSFMANFDSEDIILKDIDTLYKNNKTAMDDSYESYKYLLNQSKGNCDEKVISVQFIGNKEDFTDSNNVFYVSTQDDKLYCQLNYNDKSYSTDGYENCLNLYKEHIDV